MILTTTKDISDGVTAQVSCALGGEQIAEFYGFDIATSDDDIETFVRADLTEKGYDLGE